MDTLLFVLPGLIGLWLAALAAFLGFLGRLPRFGRVLFYAALCGVHVIAAGVFHGLRFIELNCRSGLRTQDFFTVLRDRLALEDFSAELLEIPGCTTGALLSLLAVAGIIGGLICCLVRIRVYSYFVLPAAFVVSAFLFAFPDAVKDRRDIGEHNALRRRTYAVVSEQRARGVTGRRMAAVIAAELKNFRYGYENRNGEKESAETILAALRDLTPGGEEKP